MLPLIADADFDNDILRGVRRSDPSVVITRIQDVGLRTALDSIIVDWCAKNEMNLLTHDVSTMTTEAVKRIERGAEMAGMIVVRQSLPISLVIEDIILIAGCSTVAEWAGKICYLPL
jgi:hypothetical protein